MNKKPMLNVSAFVILLCTFCLTGCKSEPENTGDSSAAYAEEVSATKTDNAASGNPKTSDTKIMSSYYKLSVPEEFKSTDADNMEFCYINGDGSSISLNVQPKDVSFSSLTADMLRKALEDTLSSSTSQKPAITDHFFTTNTVSGYPGYQYCFSYKLKDMRITQLVIGADADRTYTFTYTDTSGEWIDIFRQSSDTIQITVAD